MSNRSHTNSAHRMMNYIRKTGEKHSSERENFLPAKSHHAVLNLDVLQLLRIIPDETIQLIICDPPYNLDMASWDNFTNYVDWAANWLDEVPRILTRSGSFVLFGGIQFQDEKGGDLLELMYYLRHHSSLRLVNMIIWHYRSGMSAHRFFSNKHEEIAWYSKTKKYTFNLDAVREKYDEKTLKAYLKDKRLNPENVKKGKNPGNVWDIPRLNANAKERVGHPTQKPIAVINRIVRGLSLPGDTVLDFFAGSGTTTRVCIEHGRHSIASDLDETLGDYLSSHIENMNLSGALFQAPYEIIEYDENLKSFPPFIE